MTRIQDIGSWADEVDADIAQEEYTGFKETNSSAANQAATSGVKAEEKEEEQQQPLFTAKFINLDWQTTEEEFRGLFSEPSLGITKIDFLYDKQNKPRGIAFIDFETEADLNKVVAEWNNHELNGRNIKVFAFDHNKPKTRTPITNNLTSEGGRDFSNWEKREPSFNRNNNNNNNNNMNTFNRTRPTNTFNSSNNTNSSFRRDEWKSNTPSTSTTPATTTPPASTEPARPRVKLNLAPRTKPLDVGEETSRPSSLFGAAKPVDTAKKIREIEERNAKLEQERLEREQKLAEKAQAEREAKAKLEAARKSFAALSTEDETAKDEEVEEEITSSRKKEDLTAAEKLMYAEATQEELDGDGWSVVGSGKRAGRR
ncbi:hypothetical protein DV495_000055 [Geotrichum candidum]|nr:hypothetical protein DV452_003404 [Geotrichum candidum]KAF5136189.1 hypothetical protein DV495_000055 [Geotrichum candidum]KAI8132159.1 hypothetical protein DUD61_004178 [Geotrichum candidum]KAI9210707.1 hypothetical protein DS838_004418 [Geotrichum bryndzae]